MSLFVRDHITGATFDFAAAIAICDVGDGSGDLVVYFDGNGLRVRPEMRPGVCETPHELFECWQRERSRE